MRSVKEVRTPKDLAPIMERTGPGSSSPAISPDTKGSLRSTKVNKALSLASGGAIATGGPGRGTGAHL